MKEIELTQDKVAFVDDDLFEYLNQWKWYANNQHGPWYAIRNDKGKLVRMHHVIIGYPLNKLLVDHIDGNGLNNQRDNLRFVTPRGNQSNQKNRIHNKSSKHTGIYWNKQKQKWQVQIKINGKQTYIGRFSNEQDAVNAYQEKVNKLQIGGN